MLSILPHLCRRLLAHNEAPLAPPGLWYRRVWLAGRCGRLHSPERNIPWTIDGQIGWSNLMSYSTVILYIWPCIEKLQKRYRKSNSVRGEAAETVSTSSGLIGQTTLIKVPWGWGRKHKEFYINVWCRPPHPSLMLPHQFEIMFHACRCRKQGLNW